MSYLSVQQGDYENFTAEECLFLQNTLLNQEHEVLSHIYVFCFIIENYILKMQIFIIYMVKYVLNKII